MIGKKFPKTISMSKKIVINYNHILLALNLLRH